MIAFTQLGDLTVACDNDHLPPKMWKALATIADRLHPAYDDQMRAEGFAAGSGHDKCLFMSLTVRDFLVQIGFTDATVRGVALLLKAEEDGRETWSLGIGVPNQPDQFHKFNGHAACVVPSLDLLIDTTLYQAIRPQWHGAITGMMAVQFLPKPLLNKLTGLDIIAGVEMKQDTHEVTVGWLDRPETNWRKEPDFRTKNARRIQTTKALRDAFGNFT